MCVVYVSPVCTNLCFCMKYYSLIQLYIGFCSWPEREIRFWGSGFSRVSAQSKFLVLVKLKLGVFFFFPAFASKSGSAELRSVEFRILFSFWVSLFWARQIWQLGVWYELVNWVEGLIFFFLQFFDWCIWGWVWEDQVRMRLKSIVFVSGTGFGWSDQRGGILGGFFLDIEGCRGGTGLALRSTFRFGGGVLWGGKSEGCNMVFLGGKEVQESIFQSLELLW